MRTILFLFVAAVATFGFLNARQRNADKAQRLREAEERATVARAAASATPLPATPAPVRATSMESPSGRSVKRATPPSAGETARKQFGWKEKGTSLDQRPGR